MSSQYPTRDELVAFHEGGHAAVAYLLGLSIEDASIDPRDGGEGSVRYRHPYSDEELATYEGNPLPDELRLRWESDLKVGLGGTYGHRGLLQNRGLDHQDIRWGLREAIGSDIGLVMGQLTNHYPEGVATERIVQLARAAKDLVFQNWEVVERCALALIKQRTIGGSELDAIMRGKR